MTKLRSIGEGLFNKVVPSGVKPLIVHQVRRGFTKIERIILHKGRDLPIAVNIETNSDCTNSCYHCPRPEKEAELATEAFYSIIDQLSEWGFRGRISPHSYNEPLTDERLTGFITYAYEKLPKSEIVLYTNGDLLTDDLTSELLKVGVGEIKISLHEPTTQKLEEKVIGLHDKHKAVTLIERRDGKRDNPLSNRGGLVKFENTEKLSSCYNVDIMVIRADGNIILCHQDALGQYIFGNILQEGLAEIWNKPEFKALRNNIRHGNYTLPICEACAYEKL